MVTGWRSLRLRISVKTAPLSSARNSQRRFTNKDLKERLRKEVLVPLRKASDISADSKWGYDMEFDEEPCFASKYFEEVKSGQSKIDAGALLLINSVYLEVGIFGEMSKQKKKRFSEECAELSLRANTDIFIKISTQHFPYKLYQPLIHKTEI